MSSEKGSQEKTWRVLDARSGGALADADGFPATVTACSEIAAKLRARELFGVHAVVEAL